MNLEKIKDFFKNYSFVYDKQKILRIFVWLVSWIAISMLLIAPYFSKGINLKVGQESPVKLVSDRLVKIQTKSNRKETEDLRHKELRLVQDVYSVDPKITLESENNIKSFFERIYKYREVGVTPKLIKKELVSQETILSLVKADKNLLAYTEDKVLGLTDKFLRKGIISKDNKRFKDAFDKEVSALRFSDEYRVLISEILNVYLQANYFLDKDKTEQVRQKVICSVKPIFTIYKKGQPIVYEGDIVTEDTFQVLKSIGYIGVKVDWAKIVVSVLYIGMIIFLLFIFLYAFNRDVLYSLKKLTILLASVVIIVFLINILSMIPDIRLRYWVTFSPVPVPELISMVPMVVMFLSILLSPNVAGFAGVLAAIFSGMIFNSFAVFLYNFSLTMFSIYIIGKAKERNDITRAGISIAIFAEISICITLLLYDYPSDISSILFSMLWAVVGCVVSAVVVSGILPYFENSLRMSTPMLFIDLSNPNHPLLKRLMLEAPGTYHHSSMVAALAEPAADAIGVDNLLARAGGYYHDVGKLKRPFFFVENQQHMENPHHKLSAQMSAKVILSHPKDGVEIAKEYKLPDELVSIIESHHGDTLVYYFYQKYMQQEHVDVVQEDLFRYPGPKPHQKVSAIIFLADSVEAAVRSMDKLSPQKIEGLVKRIINNKIEDGQLDNCLLSLEEISKVSKSFIKTLAGTYHSRIEYSPDKVAKELQAREKEQNAN